ncbi:lysine--tRNA ligase [Desulfatirhabdium butyrativorans]|uniref:lysine--tRNA ligase n=1 Tax=Desulfatirhabdium butyrativorans TaxID=340467 RepID=UPI000416B847|nr:lysine--tRNA ligase [Desulfatirhabdium butyrativorans]
MSEERPGDVIEKRRRKLQELKETGIVAYPNDFRVTHCIADIQRLLAAAADGQEHLSEPIVSVAGRMMAINRFGKSAFIRFRDRSGQLQAYIQKDKVGDHAYELFKKLEAGDIVGIVGTLFKTKTGEWTLLACEFRLLCKAIRPLPEKFHGLKDPEKRYRQRYLDLIMNPSVRELFIRRSRLIQAIRNFLLDRDFLEVETPMMQTMAGGAEATPFVTHHQALDIDLYLRIAPELYLKRLVVGGFDRVFEINRNFRNEGVSTRHNPEFTMLEFYQAYAVYTDLMDLTERMFAEATRAVLGQTRIRYQEQDIEMAGPYRRVRLADALAEIGGVPKEIQSDREALLAFAQEKGVPVPHRNRLGKILTKLFDVLVEPHLIQPTFVIGYPVEVSPLSRRSDTEPELTERFELFIAGYEIANGFSELNDPQDQFGRFQQQVEDRQAGDREAHEMDFDYIEALEYGLPPTAGEGVGIDRLAMLLTDSASIREVILFPHMKPAAA